AGILDPHCSLAFEPPLRHIAEVRAIRAERPLLERRPHGALLALALRGDGRVAAETAAERRAARWQRIVDDHPRHVGLRLDFDPHARDGPAPPCALPLPLERSPRACSPV